MLSQIMNQGCQVLPKIRLLTLTMLTHVAVYAGQDLGVLELDRMGLVESVLYHCQHVRLPEPDVPVVTFQQGPKRMTSLTKVDLNSLARGCCSLPEFSVPGCIVHLKRDGTRAETRFRLSPKRMSPFKMVGASVQSTAGSQGARISGSNAGYTTFRGSVRVLATHSIRQFPLHFPSRVSSCAIRFQIHSTSEAEDDLGWQMLLLLGLDSVLLMCFNVDCMYGRKVTEVGFPLDPVVVMGGLRD